MANRDLKLLNGLIAKSSIIYDVEFNSEDKESAQKYNKCKSIIEHPIDKYIIEKIGKINIRDDIDDDYQIFKYSKEINNLWKIIIEKSIKCLRFFDSREPFLTIDSKHPVAYGVAELGNYFDKYTEFESLLYGGGKHYRDHVIHVFRTWMLGIDCLLENNGEYLKRINIGGNVQINPLEKISIWSMIALTHDLGYPLEKAQDIIGKTKEMMKAFVINPILTMDLSFSGVQNNMNDFVVRFLSSKMHEKKRKDCEITDFKCQKSDEQKVMPKQYVARLQPKYYFKFQKSLEKSKHGILSAIIIYKLLLYFLESDYNINEDYIFYEEDVRQFYIRREILRSISSHTCHDIYHLDMLNFAFLLIVVDDCQEWGRKKISELYVKTKTKYEFIEIKPNFNWKSIDIEKNGKKKKVDLHKCTVSEQFILPEEDKEGLQSLLYSMLEQSESYKEIFRDGQDTSSRNFTFVKKSKVKYEAEKTITFDIEFAISNEKESTFNITVYKTANKVLNDSFNRKFIENVYKGCKIEEKENNEELTKYEIMVKSPLKPQYTK